MRLKPTIITVLLLLLLWSVPVHAATVAFLGGTFNTTSGTKTTTQTPTAGDLIVIITGHSGNTSAATPTDDNSDGLGTYTTVVTAVTAASADTIHIHVRNALVGSGTSTIFSHAPGASTGGGLGVFRVAGMIRVGATASRQVAKQDNQAAATPAPVFAALPRTGNPVIGAVFNASNPATMTPRSSPVYSEAQDSGYGTPATGLESMFIDFGETSATITWGGASATGFGSVAVELEAVSHSGMLTFGIGD